MRLDIVILFLVGLFTHDTGPVYQVEKLHNRINTIYDETNPVISLDGKNIYFTRVGHPSFEKTLTMNHEDCSTSLTFSDYKKTLSDIYSQLGESPDVNPFSSSFNQDIWIAKTNQSEFDHIVHPSYPLNSALPNSVCAITTSPNTIVILNQFFKDGSMYKGFSFAKENHEGWQFPEPIFIYDYNNIEPGVNLTLSKDNEVMVLSMGEEKSYGQNDLYVSFRIHTTLWSAPIHMGPSINTAYREMTPFISDKKQFLFFSSNRPGGVGGNDIYVSERLDDSWTNWSTPVALPNPINSPFEDAQPFLNSHSGFLYFTSTRDGSSDIFRVDFTNPQKTIPKPVESKNIRCIVVDSKTGKAIPAKLAFGNAALDDYQKEVLVTEDGTLLPLNKGSILKFLPQKDGYISKEIKIDISNFSASKQKRLEIPIDPIAVHTKISMNPVFFMRAKDRILSSSYPELDRLSSILKTHPKIQIQINGHTDNVGDDWALYQLSEKRAVAVKRYLVNKGIQSYRIKTKGYGAARPITDNSSEKLKAKNRRVEVIITKV
jgi:outer membrane protein OmpA-like peptidoglycan-associated protein